MRHGAERVNSLELGKSGGNSLFVCWRSRRGKRKPHGNHANALRWKEDDVYNIYNGEIFQKMTETYSRTQNKQLKVQQTNMTSREKMQ
jgi:hypothetical protein